MLDDPIVEEIRKIRQMLAAEHDYDLHRMFAHWREMEKQHPDRVVASVASTGKKGNSGG